MMERILKPNMEDLKIPFRAKIINLIKKVKMRGYDMVVYYTNRHPDYQAALWRQSRSKKEIDIKVGQLRNELNSPFIADILEHVGPQYGRWATNALPGQSWHQWGEAIDAFVKNDEGHAIWSSNFDGYRVMAEEARGLSLESGFYWNSKDSVHIQFQKGSVRSNHTWEKINENVKQMFYPNGIGK